MYQMISTSYHPYMWMLTQEMPSHTGACVSDCGRYLNGFDLLAVEILILCFDPIFTALSYSISQEICTRFLLCCGYTLTDFPISIKLTSLALWQSDDCPSASKATLMNMNKYFMWIHYERLHNHNKAKHNKTVCIFLGIYCNPRLDKWQQNTWCSLTKFTQNSCYFIFMMPWWYRALLVHCQVVLPVCFYNIFKKNHTNTSLAVCYRRIVHVLTCRRLSRRHMRIWWLYVYI